MTLLLKITSAAFTIHITADDGKVCEVEHSAVLNGWSVSICFHTLDGEICFKVSFSSLFLGDFHFGTFLQETLLEVHSL